MGIERHPRVPRSVVGGGVIFRAAEVVVGGLAGEVDAEGDKGDAKARSGVAEVVGEHRVLPPLIPPPEELPRRSQRFRHPLFSALRSLSSLLPSTPIPFADPLHLFQLG